MPKRMWPESVDRVILRDGYGESTGSRLVRSQPTTGPALVRRKAGKRPDSISATLLFRSYEKYLAFRDWFEDVENGLAGGIYTVDFRHPISGRSLTVRFVPMSDDTVFTASLHGNSANAWALPVTLEVMP